MSSMDTSSDERSQSLTLSSLLTDFSKNLRLATLGGECGDTSTRLDGQRRLSHTLQAKLNSLLQLTDDVQRSLGRFSCSLEQQIVRRTPQQTTQLGVVPVCVRQAVVTESDPIVGIIGERSSTGLIGEICMSPEYRDFNYPKSDQVCVERPSSPTSARPLNWSLRFSTLKKRSVEKNDLSVAIGVRDGNNGGSDLVLDASDNLVDESGALTSGEWSDTPLIIDCTSGQDVSTSDDDSVEKMYPHQMTIRSSSLLGSAGTTNQSIIRLIKPCSVVVPKLPLKQFLTHNLDGLEPRVALPSNGDQLSQSVADEAEVQSNSSSDCFSPVIPVVSGNGTGTEFQLSETARIVSKGTPPSKGSTSTSSTLQLIQAEHSYAASSTSPSPSLLSRCDSKEQNQSSNGSVEGLDIVSCPSCSAHISYKIECVFLHKRLPVITCKQCWRRFQNGSFDVNEEDSHENYCTLCGDGGELVLCDFCEKAVCQKCLNRIHGDGYSDTLIESESQWKCFCCDPSSLHDYTVQKDKVMLALTEKKSMERKHVPAARNRVKEARHKIDKTPRHLSKRMVSVVKSKEFVDSSDDSDFDMKSSCIGLSPAEKIRIAQRSKTHSPASIVSESDVDQDRSRHNHEPSTKTRSILQLKQHRTRPRLSSDFEAKNKKGKKSLGRHPPSVSVVKKEKHDFPSAVSSRRKPNILTSSESEADGVFSDLCSSGTLVLSESDDFIPPLIESKKQPQQRQLKKTKQSSSTSRHHLMRSDYGIETMDRVSDSYSDDDSDDNDKLEVKSTLNRRRIISSSSTSSTVSSTNMRKRKRPLHTQLSSGSEEEHKGTINQLVLSPLSLLSGSSTTNIVTGGEDSPLQLHVTSKHYDSSDSSASSVSPHPKKKRQRRKLFMSSSSDYDTGNSEGHLFLSSIGANSLKVPGKKRRRVRKELFSSDSEFEDSNYRSRCGRSEKDEKILSTPGRRKDIKKLIPEAKLAEKTKQAQLAERERIKRLEERRKQLAAVEEHERLILEHDAESKEVLMEVRRTLLSSLKPHQRDGIKFLYDCCCENLDRLKNKEGSGAILAHCMGLGKTLQVIALIDALFVCAELTGVGKVLVLCPVNALLNWKDEFEKWIPWDQRDYPVMVLDDHAVNVRHRKLQRWFNHGGVMLMGYDMYRNLATGKRIKNRRIKNDFAEFLLNPGPDIIVCDEGHVLKSSTTGLSQVLAGIRTKRRIILTGTPLQNNLLEYYCMVNFVKPDLLGTIKEFRNRFANPIRNGQHRDSVPSDVILMKQRAHVLHKVLSGCVDRKDYRILAQSLPQKYEYVISVRMSEIQETLIIRYLQKSCGQTASDLFSTFSSLSKVWNHPWILKLYEVQKARQELDEMLNDDSEGSMADFINDDSDDLLSVSSSKENSRRSSRCSSTSSDLSVIILDPPPPSKPNGKPGGEVKKEQVDEKSKTPSPRQSWYSDVLHEGIAWDVSISGKIKFLLELLQEVERVKEKLLVFSQNLLVLDYIEELIKRPEHGSMVEGMEYLRIDGSTKIDSRASFMKQFNKKTNDRLRLFLISTRAGSMGVNLIGANRVVIFDACWNPSHDLQSIFRTYRFGQTKPVFVYRLLAQGTMEEKIYDRQVTKQSLSMRVIDEKQIGRHYTFSQLSELFTYTPAPPPSATPPKEPCKRPDSDIILSQVLDKLQPRWVVGYHEHDSLLEHVFDEELSEEEQKKAWELYNREKTMEYNIGLIGARADSLSQQPTSSSVESMLHPRPAAAAAATTEAAANHQSNPVQQNVRLIMAYLTNCLQAAKNVEANLLSRRKMEDALAAGRPFSQGMYNRIKDELNQQTKHLEQLIGSLRHVIPYLNYFPEANQLYSTLLKNIERIDQLSSRYRVPVPGQAPFYSVQSLVQVPGQSPVHVPGQSPVHVPGQRLSHVPDQRPVHIPGQRPVHVPAGLQPVQTTQSQSPPTSHP